MKQKHIAIRIPGITPPINNEPTETDAVVANTTIGMLGGIIIPKEADV